MKRSLIVPVALAACLSLGSFRGCNCDEGPDDCLLLTEIQTDEVSPAGVRTVFQATDCDGAPIPDLTDADITVLLDGQELQTEGDVAPVLSQAVEFEMYTLLLLDLSDSIVESGNLLAMLNAARTLVGSLVAQGQRVAIYRFAGPAYFAEVQDFTVDETALYAALDELSESSGLGTTDLYGSIVKALQVLDGVSSPEVLHTTTLVLFTDGTDEAMASSASQAQQAVDTTDANVFAVGLGGDVNKEELVELGKDGFEWAEESDDLQDAFARITDSISAIAHSYYLIAVCSPRVGGWRSMTIEARKRGETGSLEVNYRADGFDIVGCDPGLVADPCQDKDCGHVDGFTCGECEGTEFCNELQHCEDACEGLECGESLGFDCGDCFELYGEGWGCDAAGQCVEACDGVECGDVLGVDCGDCAELGETWSCEEHECVDACEGRECGENLGFDCGDCAELHDASWGCDESGTCVEACAEVECGLSFGVDCGDCSALGATWSCAEGTCVDACAAVECGPVGELDCGDCSGLGWGWACDDNACVEACSGLECGEVLGVDCGDCENGFACSAGHLCEPIALPGMTWVQVPGGDFTLGCDSVLDPACDLDEQRRDVLLSAFWIMDTEVTVAMYNLCVSDGDCLMSHVGTGGQCNFGKAGYGEHPINCLDWAGLQEFCAYVGGAVPSEAQWERAARGDHDGEAAGYWLYPWGSTPAPSCASVVMNDGDPGCGLGHTDEVGTKPATSFGLLNMAGNVSEWVADWYGEALGDCGVGDCTDPEGPDSGTERVVRGGNWNDLYASAFRTAMRDKDDPATKSAGIGGRCMRW